MITCLLRSCHNPVSRCCLRWVVQGLHRSLMTYMQTPGKNKCVAFERSPIALLCVSTAVLVRFQQLPACWHQPSPGPALAGLAEQ